MANNPNVNKVIYGNQTVMDITDTTATEGDVANGAVFYKANGARSVGTATPSAPEWGDITGTLSDQTDLQTAIDGKFDRSEQRVLGAKNLLPNLAYSQTKFGITFTVNSDGSVIANGTATSRVILELSQYTDNVHPPAGNYILGKGVSQNNVTLVLDCWNGSQWVKEIASSGGTNDEVSAVIDYDGYDRIRCYLAIEYGTTVTNVKFYFSLYLASDPDSTYVPYAMTNRELTKKGLTDWNYAYQEVSKTFAAEATLTTAVASGGYVYLPGGNNSAHWWGGHPDLSHYHIVPTGDMGNGKSFKYTTCEALDESSGWKIRIKVAEDIPANAKVGAFITVSRWIN